MYYHSTYRYYPYPHSINEHRQVYTVDQLSQFIGSNVIIMTRSGVQVTGLVETIRVAPG